MTAERANWFARLGIPQPDCAIPIICGEQLAVRRITDNRATRPGLRWEFQVYACGPRVRVPNTDDTFRVILGGGKSFTIRRIGQRPAARALAERTSFLAGVHIPKSKGVLSALGAPAHVFDG